MLDDPKYNPKKSRSGLFISYARSDGKNFADDLRRRLVDEYHFQVWHDIVELEGGKDWLRPWGGCKSKPRSKAWNFC
jgi:hypothetical protein